MLFKFFSHFLLHLLLPSALCASISLSLSLTIAGLLMHWSHSVTKMLLPNEWALPTQHNDWHGYHGHLDNQRMVVVSIIEMTFYSPYLILFRSLRGFPKGPNKMTTVADIWKGYIVISQCENNITFAFLSGEILITIWKEKNDSNLSLIERIILTNCLTLQICLQYLHLFCAITISTVKW